MDDQILVSQNLSQPTRSEQRQHFSGKRGMDMINVGVIGFGYWGPNVARNFNEIPGAKVVAISDADEASLRRAEQSYPGIRMARDDSDL
jgi:predicted homoserine dehydrogenase-like protein